MQGPDRCSAPCSRAAEVVALKWLDVRDYLTVKDLARVAKSCSCLRSLVLDAETGSKICLSLIELRYFAERRRSAFQFCRKLNSIHPSTLKHLSVEFAAYDFETDDDEEEEDPIVHRSTFQHITFHTFATCLSSCTSLNSLEITVRSWNAGLFNDNDRFEQELSLGLFGDSLSACKKLESLTICVAYSVEVEGDADEPHSILRINADVIEFLVAISRVIRKINLREICITMEDSECPMPFNAACSFLKWAIIDSPSLESIKLDKGGHGEIFDWSCPEERKLISTFSSEKLCTLRSFSLSVSIQHWKPLNGTHGEVPWLDTFVPSKNLEHCQLQIYGDFCGGRNAFLLKTSAFLNDMEKVESLHIDFDRKCDENVGEAVAALIKRRVLYLKSLHLTGVTFSPRTAKDIREVFTKAGIDGNLSKNENTKTYNLMIN